MESLLKKVAHYKARKWLGFMEERMKKTFCDICKEEIKNSNENWQLSLNIRKSLVEKEYILKLEDTCLNCRRDLIRRSEEKSHPVKVK